MQIPESSGDVYTPPKGETEEPTEQPESGPDVKPLSGQDAPTTTQLVPEEVMNF